MAGRVERNDLRIESECRTDEGFRSLTLYGSGVGIWSGQTQFRLTPVQVTEILQAFRRARFVKLDDTYGEGEEEHRVLKVICSVSLAVGEASKRVTQLEQGKQSRELKRLAREIFALCEEPARSGVTAGSLSDGLWKISRGELAPEALRALVHRKPESGSTEGFLLRLDGPRAETQSYTTSGGYADLVVLNLRSEEVAELAGALAEADPDLLPPNLYAEDYTDLTLRVLGREKSVQARRFAGMEPTTQGERQRDFDRLFEALRALHLRVLSEGRRQPAPPEPES